MKPEEPTKRSILDLNTYENYDFNTTIPRSDRSEVALLSSMMLQPSAAKSAFAWGISEEDFFDTRNVALFGILKTLMEAGKPLDFVLVMEEADKTGGIGAHYASEVFSFCTSGCNWQYYCDILREKTVGRKAIIASARIRGLCAGSTLGIEGSILEEIDKIKSEITGRQAQSSTASDALESLVDFLESEVPAECFCFGLPQLDDKLRGGIQRGELVVVAGYAGGGKSILLAMAALEAIRVNKTVAYFSIEMTPGEIVRRMAANYISVPIKARSEYPTAKEMDAAADAISFLRRQKSQIAILKEDVAIHQIEVQVAHRRPDLVIVDYVQLVQCDEGDNREQQVSAIARRLKTLAMTTNTAILTASQLNDEGKLRESRAIGQHSDHVISILEGSTEIYGTKNRRGPTGWKVSVMMRGDISRFE